MAAYQQLSFSITWLYYFSTLIFDIISYIDSLLILNYSWMLKINFYYRILFFGCNADFYNLIFCLEFLLLYLSVRFICSVLSFPFLLLSSFLPSPPSLFLFSFHTIPIRIMIKRIDHFYIFSYGLNILL